MSISEDDYASLIEENERRRIQFRKAFLVLSDETAALGSMLAAEAEEAITKKFGNEPRSPSNSERPFSRALMAASAEFSSIEPTPQFVGRLGPLFEEISLAIGERFLIVWDGRALGQSTGIELPVDFVGLSDRGSPVLIQVSDAANFESVAGAVMGLVSSLDLLREVDLGELRTSRSGILNDGYESVVDDLVNGEVPEVTWKEVCWRVIKQSAVLVLAVGDALPTAATLFLDWVSRRVGPAKLIVVRASSVGGGGQLSAR